MMRMRLRIKMNAWSMIMRLRRLFHQMNPIHPMPRHLFPRALHPLHLIRPVCLFILRAATTTIHHLAVCHLFHLCFCSRCLHHLSWLQTCPQLDMSLSRHIINNSSSSNLHVPYPHHHVHPIHRRIDRHHSNRYFPFKQRIMPV